MLENDLHFESVVSTKGRLSVLYWTKMRWQWRNLPSSAIVLIRFLRLRFSDSHEMLISRIVLMETLTTYLWSRLTGLAYDKVLEYFGFREAAMARPSGRIYAWGLGDFLALGEWRNRQGLQERGPDHEAQSLLLGTMTIRFSLRHFSS